MSPRRVVGSGPAPGPRKATPEGPRSPQATLRHTRDVAYGCSRQGLTRFAPARCRGPTVRAVLRRLPPGGAKRESTIIDGRAWKSKGNVGKLRARRTETMPTRVHFIWCGDYPASDEWKVLETPKAVADIARNGGHE